jgi:flagellar hook assembly protein FlgD
VSSNPSLRILRTFVFPNPVRWGGPARIVVDAQGGPVNCLVRIYTVSGRLIRTLKSFGALGQLQLDWDGLDAEGNALANGVYLYRVQVNGRDALGASNPRQSDVAEGRIVVVR